VHPEKQAEGIIKILPNIKRLGLIYNPARMGQFVERLTRSLRSHSVAVVAKKVNSSSAAARALQEMKGRVDALLLLPDVTVATPEMVDLMLIFSYRNAAPVIAFSEKYVRMGALAAIMASPRDLGAQAGELARTQFSGSGHKKVVSYARKGMIIINTTIAQKLGIKLREDLLRSSYRIE
jgi:putative ABC transport system substrate-binding protein